MPCIRENNTDILYIRNKVIAYCVFQEKKYIIRHACSSLPDAIPRFIRVNRLKTTVDKVIENFIKDGFCELPQDTPLNELKYAVYVRGSSVFF